MSGRIRTAEHVTEDVERRCDVCIVGSGAGGAVLAAGLAEAGLSVIMLEEGGYHTRNDFTLNEGDAYPAMYQDRGTRATSDLAITILQGRSVGGSTTVNWTTCFRTPERILEHWQRVHGLELDAATLAPHFEAVEQRLSIKEWPREVANANNQVLYRGCDALGWAVAPLRRNVKGCANSGYCGLGCPVDGKQAMHVTYLPDAVFAGMDLYANARVDRFEVEAGRVVAVHARVMSDHAGLPDGPRITIRPKVAVCAGGAINGPALLLRSGLTGAGRVGTRTFLHPVVATVGDFPDPIRPFFGAPQAAGSHHFIDRGADKVGFFIEAAPLHPMLSAVAYNPFGQRLHTQMADLASANGLLALQVDGLLPQDDGGTVSLKADGRIQVDYPVRPFLVESMRFATEQLVKIQLAAGAVEVGTAHLDPVRVRTEADLVKLESAAYGAHEHAIFTAHQMGGCAMGADPERSVVDLEHRFRGVDNLFVVDGSVLPTSLGVNPSETIYGLAHRARTFVGNAV